MKHANFTHTTILIIFLIHLTVAAPLSLSSTNSESENLQTCSVDELSDYEEPPKIDPSPLKRTPKKRLKKTNTRGYVDQYTELALREQARAGIPVSITLAQGIIESANGNSFLARKANNHFGIKAFGWKGKFVVRKDDNPDDKFRVYSSVYGSFQDHTKVLQGRRYKECHECENYKGWAKCLQRNGYATNPKYSKLLISIIEKYKLYELDVIKM